VNFKLTPKQRRLAAQAQAQASDVGKDAGAVASVTAGAAAGTDKIFNIAAEEFAGYAEFFEENQLEELMIEEKGTRVLLRKHPKRQMQRERYPWGGEGMPPALPQAAPLGAPQGAPKGTAAAAEDADASENGASAEPETYTKILSPLNGNCYITPSPEAPSFVSAGSTVSAGTVLCLIEAMKIFNELKAETSGRIVKVLVKNAESVKEGQELFWIE